MTQKNRIIQYLSKTYHTNPEYLFKTDPNSCIFRHRDNLKWYGIIMNIPGRRVGLSTDEPIDILNVKCDPDQVSFLAVQKGFAPAYHMNKTHWLTILLDGSVSEKQIYRLIDRSFELTKNKS